jgi:NAD-dependent glycerol-3-phosphate dehydrogenase C-terminus
LLGNGLQTITELLREVTPVRRLGALAGPLVAKSLADSQPGGGIVGSLFPEVAETVREAIGGSSLRIHDTQDVVGVEMASALVGLVALVVGHAMGSGFGPGPLAVLATRGVAESARVAGSCGAQERTFSGFGGLWRPHGRGGDRGDACPCGRVCDGSTGAAGGEHPRASMVIHPAERPMDGEGSRLRRRPRFFRHLTIATARWPPQCRHSSRRVEPV